MTELSERLVKAKAALFGGTEADWKSASAAIDEAIATIDARVTEEMVDRAMAQGRQVGLNGMRPIGPVAMRSILEAALGGGDK